MPTILDLNSQLKPCPYCESEAEVVEVYEDNTTPYISAIYCTGCPLGVEDHGIGYKELIKIWNNIPREVNDEN